MNESKKTKSTIQETNPSGNTWSPLKNRLFAIIFFTLIFSQIALFMNGLASSWVLTDITDSPTIVASLQIAIVLPAFFLALIAGALADIVNRKRIIIFSLAGSVIVGAVFAWLSVIDMHSTATLLELTAVLGILTSLAAPSWIAIIPELVPRTDLAGAMTLTSAGMSAAMAIGPAIAGVIIGIAGPTWVFFLNMAAFAGGIIALRTWNPSTQTGLPPEHLGSAIRTGLQYVRYDKPIKFVIGKLIPFALVSTALLSLLPAVARFRLEAGPTTFGLLSGAGGVGAVVSLLAMPRIRRSFSPDAIVFVAMLINAGAFIVIGTSTNITLVFGVLLIIGAANLALISTMMTMLQIVLPAWIRGRGVAVYLLALQGSFALGAFIWGSVAEQSSLQTALISAGLLMGVSSVLLTRLRLRPFLNINTEPVEIMPTPPTVTSVHDEDGPILITAEWQTDPSRRDEFIAAMEPVRRALLQKGALNWQLVEHVEKEGLMLESFTVATWSEFLRLGQRATEQDLEVVTAMQEASGSDLPPFQAHRVIKV